MLGRLACSFVLVSQLFLVLLTFGLASPLLALVLILAFVTNLMTTIAGINCYLEVSPRCRQLHQTKILEEALCVAYDSRASFGNETVTPVSSTADTSNDTFITVADQAAGDIILIAQTVRAATTGTKVDPTGGLEEACVLSAWAPHSLYWPVAVIASSFWGLMVFDMVGNTVVADPSKALWAPLVACLVPLAMGAAFFLLRLNPVVVTGFAHFLLRRIARGEGSTAAGNDFGLEGRETVFSPAAADTSVAHTAHSGILNSPQLNPI